MNRYWLFHNYWWIAILISLICITSIILLSLDNQFILIGSIIASGLGFCYFVQQQRLAEINLFKDIFTNFNNRYDKINDKLYMILKSHNKLTPIKMKFIYDYFNLCSEEYLFFKEGYIYRDVWKAWCRGMLIFIDKKPFDKIWEIEEQTDSYYGLTLKKIKEGAA